MQSNNDPYLTAGYKLKTKEQQIEELNKDLMYWNGKMCASTSSTEIENAHAMIKIIQSEFDKLNNSNNLFHSNFRNDDHLRQQLIKQQIETRNTLTDELMAKGKTKELFMCGLRD